MELITYTLTSLVTVLGLFIGLILCIISPEELKPGKKHFKLTKHILFYLIIFFSLIFFYKNKVYMMISLVILVVYFLKFKFKEPIIYLLISILFYLSSYEKNSFIVISSVIFIYSIFLSINLRIKHLHKNNWNVIKLLLFNYVWFLIGSVILFFVL